MQSGIGLRLAGIKSVDSMQLYFSSQNRKNGNGKRHQQYGPNKAACAFCALHRFFHYFLGAVDIRARPLVFSICAACKRVHGFPFPACFGGGDSGGMCNIALGFGDAQYGIHGYFAPVDDSSRHFVYPPIIATGCMEKSAAFAWSVSRYMISDMALSAPAIRCGRRVNRRGLFNSPCCQEDADVQKQVEHYSKNAPC